jgi:glycerol-3-phosphate acyltransferase PlsY
MLLGILSLIAAYLLGSIPFGKLLVQLTTGADIQKMGSGNIGAANVAREAGTGLGIAVLLLDAGKGFLATWLACRLTEGTLHFGCGAALLAMLGHIFPVFLGFKGGKAVATFFGAFAWLAPLPVAAIAIVYVGGMLLSGYSSMGSTMAAAAFPLAIWMIEHPPKVLTGSAVIAAGLILWRHIGNFQRVHDGTEPPLRKNKQ